MNVKYLRENYVLQFIIYAAEIKPAFDGDAEEFQIKHYRLADQSTYYKTKKYACYKCSPLVSKFKLRDNPDESNK